MGFIFVAQANSSTGYDSIVLTEVVAEISEHG